MSGLPLDLQKSSILTYFTQLMQFAQMNVRPICIVLPINNLLVKCDKCEMECSVKGCRKFDRSTGHDKGIGVSEEVDVL